MDYQSIIDQIRSECVGVVVWEADEYGPEFRDLCRNCKATVLVLHRLKSRECDPESALPVCGE